MDFPFYNPAKVLLYMKELDERTPVYADLHPSNICNHQCVWCRYMRTKEMLSMESMVNFLDRYPRIKGITIGGGGEPMTNRYLLDFIVECRRRGIKTGIFTNGSLFDGRSLDIIGNNCQFCRISLDAATPETHASLHKSKDFHKILDNIRKLRETRLPELGISYLVTADNVADIPLLSELNLPVDYIHFKPLVEGIDQQTREKALKVLPVLQKRVDYAIKFDRIKQDLMCNHKIRCRIADLITLLAANNKEYVCCEHDDEEAFEKEKWDGSNTKCHTCRYNPYNEIIDLYRKNAFAKEFL